ncbi:hypothetical protein [Paenibacillus mucilaginosus]|uniref:hypothetical protein n=1 Tax=Paenibacillus mucilaginosus TaxID=61624 RepID=UPI00240D46A8|nr:hypothetical protein [Paenibacillus mucilaginosus]
MSPGFGGLLPLPGASSAARRLVRHGAAEAPPALRAAGGAHRIGEDADRRDHRTQEALTPIRELYPGERTSEAADRLERS